MGRRGEGVKREKTANSLFCAELRAKGSGQEGASQLPIANLKASDKLT